MHRRVPGAAPIRTPTGNLTRLLGTAEFASSSRPCLAAARRFGRVCTVRRRIVFETVDATFDPLQSEDCRPGCVRSCCPSGGSASSGCSTARRIRRVPGKPDDPQRAVLHRPGHPARRSP